MVELDQLTSCILSGGPQVVVDQVGVDEALEVLLRLVLLQVDHGDVLENVYQFNFDTFQYTS